MGRSVLLSLPAALFPPRSALFSFPSAILRITIRTRDRSARHFANYFQREGYISGLSYDWSRDRCFFLEFEWWPFVFNVSRRSFLLFLNFFFFLIGIIGNCVIHVFSNRRFKWTAEAGLGSSLGFGMIIFGIGSLLRIPRPVWTPSILGADHFEPWLSSTLTSWEGGLLTILAGWLIWGLVIFENCDRFFTLTVKAKFKLI